MSFFRRTIIPLTTEWYLQLSLVSTTSVPRIRTALPIASNGVGSDKHTSAGLMLHYLVYELFESEARVGDSK